MINLEHEYIEAGQRAVKLRQISIGVTDEIQRAALMMEIGRCEGIQDLAKRLLKDFEETDLTII
jgi:hypothetical protein